MDFWTVVLRHNWTPNGDTTSIGGITITFYGITALLCLMVAFRHRPANAKNSSEPSLPLFEKFWFNVGLIFFLLALHKHFNWLVGMTNFVRNHAYYYAWYSGRRAIQNQFITFAIILTLCFVVWVLWRIRHGGKAKLFALIGLCSLVTFVVIRSISLHSIDALLYYRYMGWLQLNRVIELGGIGVVAISAICAWRR